jgi:threonine aldolase
MFVDIRSDTVTKPSQAMRNAMANAEVGDDVLDGDPSVRRLEERVATLLGKDAALFLPTGSMGNLVGVAVHTTPGSEVLVDTNAHVMQGEMAGVATMSMVQFRLVPSSDGRSMMGAADLQRSIRPVSKHNPLTSLICLENTHNAAGGAVTSIDESRAMRDVANDAGIPVHMDGARLWNASAATGVAIAEFAACADTVMVSLSKGLGCPVGAMLAGSTSAMDRAHRIRKRVGGGMRQSGILAAAGLYALDHNLDRLPADHENARLFAAAIDGAAGATVVPPDSNIVMVDLPPSVAATDVVARAKQAGVLITAWTPTRVRAVAHLDVDAAAMARAAEVVRTAIEECRLVALLTPG